MDSDRPDSQNDDGVLALARALHAEVAGQFAESPGDYLGQFDAGRVAVDGQVDFFALARCAASALSSPLRRAVL